MSHPRAFEEWEGQLVKLNESNTEVAVLREVTEWRIVPHYSKLIRLPRQQTEYSESERQIHEFRPWHTIRSIRLLEPEEKKAGGFQSL